MISTTTSRLRKHSKSGTRRRGATLVVVALMFTVIMGVAAMALDFSRMYEFKAQIKTLADAAAMSGILDRRDGRTESQAEANAFVLTPANRVEGTGQATMTAADITPVTWDPITRTSVASIWDTANAVKVAVHYTSNWTLARVFGATSKTLNDTTIALFGSLVSSSCMKPMAMPYASILDKLGQSAPYNMSYELTAADIALLDNSTAEIQFNGDLAPDARTPGNFGWVDTDVSSESNKNQQIANALTGCNSGSIGVDSDLEGITGNRNSSEVRAAIDALCGGTTTCDLSKPPVLVAIYSSTAGGGSNATFHVKYIGAFKFTRQDSGNNLYGYLTSTDVAPTGQVSGSQVGPVMVRPQIVK